MNKVNVSGAYDSKKIYGKQAKTPKQFNYQMPHVGKNFWYIVAKADAGSKTRMILLGPYPTEEKAFEVATDKLNTTFDVIELNTRDRNAATQILRHRVLNDSKDISLSIRRMRHQV